MKELMLIKQLPIITQHLEEKSLEIKAKTANYLSMPCTDKTVKAVKAARAELNSGKKEFETRRIAIKKKILEPYEAFEKIYKANITDIYADADSQLKIKIDDVEDSIKALHAADVRQYFDSYLADFPAIDFLTFERVGLNITKTVSVEALIKQCADFIDKVSDDLDMIALQADQGEILVEYIPTLNAVQAITTVASRHKAIEAQKAAIEAQKQTYKPVATPVIVTPIDDFAIPDFSPSDFDFPELEPKIAPITKSTGTATYRIAIIDTIERIDALIDMLERLGYYYDEI